jgi:hypothetical protein
MSESTYVNKGFYFKARRTLKPFRAEIKNFLFLHGSCDCGRSDIDVAIVTLRQPIRMEFWNGKVKESDSFVLGSECVVQLRQKLEGLQHD